MGVNSGDGKGRRGCLEKFEIESASKEFVMRGLAQELGCDVSNLYGPGRCPLNRDGTIFGRARES